jgi:hypothetical protein
LKFSKVKIKPKWTALLLLLVLLGACESKPANNSGSVAIPNGGPGTGPGGGPPGGGSGPVLSPSLEELTIILGEK